MNNLEIYNQGRQVPPEAIKTITAGNLKGFSDINPMWRIKKLTEIFGACGIGWYYDLLKYDIIPCANNGEVILLATINLYVKSNDEWSKPIVGVGGSKLIAMYTKGLSTNDEALKMATTDAISVACKNLGIGADVYFEKDRTKYSSPATLEDVKKEGKAKGYNIQEVKPITITLEQSNEILAALPAGLTAEWLCEKYKIKSLLEIKQSQLPGLLKRLGEMKVATEAPTSPLERAMNE